MRSSKNRSRSKGNRNRPSGNIVNRVFDSSGPEGKVRGTPQQIIDKYNQLARDAQLGNDRVAAENFQQHAEHYTRLLSEAQREMDARREQQEQQQNQRRERNQDGRNQDQSGGGDAQNQNQPQAEAGDTDQPTKAFDDVIDAGSDGEAAIVETPEDNPKPRRGRRPRRNGADGQSAEGGEASATPPEAAAE